jgi:hypothetical protein
MPHVWRLPYDEKMNPFKQICHALTRRDFYTFGKAKVFSTLDLRFSYHQIPLKASDKVKTIF